VPLQSVGLPTVDDELDRPDYNNNNNNNSNNNNNLICIAPVLAKKTSVALKK